MRKSLDDSCRSGLITKKPDRLHLCNELPKDEDASDTFRLLEYLGIKSFPSPFLKDKYLVQSNPIDIGNINQRLQYHKASLFEASQTAPEFVIALGTSQYKVQDRNTIDAIFSLVNTILFLIAMFSAHDFDIIEQR